MNVITKYLPKMSPKPENEISSNSSQSESVSVDLTLEKRIQTVFEDLESLKAAPIQAYHAEEDEKIESEQEHQEEINQEEINQEEINQEEVEAAPPITHETESSQE